MHFKSFEELVTIEPLFYEQQWWLLLIKRTCCLCLTDWSAFLKSFQHTTMLHLYNPELTRLCAWVNGSILQNLVFIWSF